VDSPFPLPPLYPSMELEASARYTTLPYSMAQTPVTVGDSGNGNLPLPSHPALNLVVEDELMVADAAEDMIVVDEGILEVVKTVMGRVYTFVVGPDRDDLSADALVDEMSSAPLDGNGQSKVIVPDNLKAEFVKALQGRLTKQSRYSCRRPGSIAFRIKNEYFFRPALSRSLSLP